MRTKHAIVAAAVLLAGCGKSKPSAPDASTDADASATVDAGPAGAGLSYGAPVASAFAPDKVVAAVNPKHVEPYAGPKGTLRGTIRIDGEPSPDTGLKFPDRCKDALATYGKLFRVGEGHALADALVAVTGYGDRGYVPASAEAVRVDIRHCATQKRTYAVTYGQRMDAFNTDPAASYMPFLDGVSTRTIMVAIPKGDPVKLYPTGPGPKLYMLRDQLESGLVAHVFVVNYATVDVTGLDGRYEIRNIPAGRVRVDVLLPVIEKSKGEEVDVKEGDNTFDLTLYFDAQSDLPKPPSGLDAGAAAGSARPAASAKRPILK
jgi:hypothetical protein